MARTMDGLYHPCPRASICLKVYGDRDTWAGCSGRVSVRRSDTPLSSPVTSAAAGSRNFHLIPYNSSKGLERFHIMAYIPLKWL